MSEPELQQFESFSEIVGQHTSSWFAKYSKDDLNSGLPCCRDEVAAGHRGYSLNESMLSCGMTSIRVQEEDLW